MTYTFILYEGEQVVAVFTKPNQRDVEDYIRKGLTAELVCVKWRDRVSHRLIVGEWLMDGGQRSCRLVAFKNEN